MLLSLLSSNAGPTQITSYNAGGTWYTVYVWYNDAGVWSVRRFWIEDSGVWY